MTATKDYLTTLLRYYEEEIAGEAYFYGLRNHFEQKEKLNLLAQVERFAAQSVQPLLEKYALTPKSEQTLKAEGEGHVLRHDSYSWPELINYMAERYPAYLDDFENLKSMAPEEDWPQLEVLTEHEVAAIKFARKELVGDPHSIQPLLSYLQQ